MAGSETLPFQPCPNRLWLAKHRSRYAEPVQVTLDIPDALAAQIAANGQDPAHAALQALTLTQNAEAYQRLLDLAAEADVHEAIRQGREDVAMGRTRAANEVFDEIRKQYGVPR